jgi:hypothetical protein
VIAGARIRANLSARSHSPQSISNEIPSESSAMKQQVLHRSSVAGLFLFVLCATGFGQGSDNCATAQVISAGNGAHNFVNNGANTDGPPSSVCSFFGQDQIQADVWFNWTATANGTVTITTCGSTPLDSKIAAYLGTGCPVGTPLDCSDDDCTGGGLQSTLTFSITNGTSYKLRVGVYPGTATGAGQIVITQAPSGGGTNDSCSNPAPIAGFGTYAFDNTNATTDGVASTLCDFFGTQQIERDVWFLWTANATGTALVQTCGQTTIDSKIAAYVGASCGSAPVACNDDSADCGGGSLQSSMTFSTTAGQAYLLRVGVFPGAAGGTGAIVISDGGGGGGGDCATPSNGPDVIVGALSGIAKFGTVGTLTGYSIGTDSCNIGTQGLSWVASTNQHPVIGQNMYRLKNGRFEQIGMSWLKHGFLALNQSLCCSCNNPGTGAILGVGCSDPYDAQLNGFQEGSGGTGGLGPRSEVNPTSGAFPFPYTTQGQGGNAIYKRVQVQLADLDPAQNAGASYFAEGHYVAPDDATAGNRNNNASHRPMQVGSFTGGGWNLSLSGATARRQAAIRAWDAAQPSVDLQDVQVDGLFIAGSDATDNGDGTWSYEYAVYNMNSDRGAQAFSVPVPAGTAVTNIGFHDVDSHSGEPYSTTDWAASNAGGNVSWSTQTFAQNVNANALRWGTLYNFRFTADRAPVTGAVSLTLFKPGSPSSVSVQAFVPDPSGAPISSFCFGDLSGTPCPCGNDAAPGAGTGCLSSLGIGALLAGSGNPSITNDNFVLSGSGMPNSSALYFQGTTQVSSVFGDGLRCAGGAVIRLGTKINAGGASQYPQGADPDISVAGGNSVGSIRTYQVWYRNAAAFCTPSGFNLSNGVQAIWQP